MKLSEELRKLRDVADENYSSRHGASYDEGRMDAFNESLDLAEAYEAETEKRIAELEQRLRTVAEALLELSPGPHPGPMNAEEYVPLIGERIAELELQRSEMTAELARERQGNRRKATAMWRNPPSIYAEDND